MLTEKQTAVAEDLTYGELNRSQIAEKHGISRKTLYEWLKDQEFTKLLDELSATAVEATRTSIKASTDRAFSELTKLLSSKSERVRLLAATSLLDRAGLSSEMIVKMGVRQEPAPEMLNVEFVKKRLQERKNVEQQLMAGSGIEILGKVE